MTDDADDEITKPLGDAYRAFWLAVRNNYAPMAGLGYIWLSLYGLIYQWFYFDSFFVNIFDYMEPGDLLLTAVKAPFSSYLSFSIVSLLPPLAVMMIWLYIRTLYGMIARACKRLFNLDSVDAWNVYRILFVFVLPGVVLLSPLTGAWLQAQTDAGALIRSSPNLEVEVRSLSPDSPFTPDKRFNLIGTTDRFFFFREEGENGQLRIVGVSNIVSITPR